VSFIKVAEGVEGESRRRYRSEIEVRTGSGVPKVCFKVEKVSRPAFTRRRERQAYQRPISRLDKHHEIRNE
jgi:hypothetical protein